MKVLYDHQAFSLQAYGGVSRYFFELINHFSKGDGVEVKLALRTSPNLYLRHLRSPGRKVSIGNDGDRDWKRIRKALNAVGEGLWKNRVFSSLFFRMNLRESVRCLRGQDFDLFHPTYFTPYFLSRLGKKPFVLTVFDMTHELFPEMFPAGDKTASWKEVLAQKAAKIIAISHSTKNDLMRYFNIREERIAVTHLASSISIEGHPGSPGLTLPKRYILFVGNRDKASPFKERYKNFTFFIRSIHELLKEDRDLSLICAGGGRFHRQERSLFNELGIEKKVFQYPATDRTLVEFYRNAMLLVLPSLYEGFGLPVLEAFSCGCPAAVSRAGALPEVAGEGALYFDPGEETSIREAVRNVIEDKTLREHLRSEGYKQARKFSWQKTAGETKAVYESVLS
jgi:glycosyltransferase involved in cell wall biosynthesis